MTNTRLPVQNQASFLAGSGCIVGATSITLQSFTRIDGTVLTLANFGTKGFMTLEPNNATQEEQISFTGLTQNANGTCTLSGVSTVLTVSPYTETSGTAVAHPGGSVAIVTNTAQWYAQIPFKANDETITGQWTFSVFPITPSNSDASTTVKGVTKLSVAPVSATEPIAAGTNDGRIPVAYAVDSVGTDAYAITPSPAITAYVAGQRFSFKAGTANTGAATLAVSGLAATPIKKGVTFVLDTGDILANQVVTVIYDGTNMQLQTRTPQPIPLTTVYAVAGSPATWTKAANLDYVVVEVVGAGGGGGGSTSTSIGGGGGGGGGYSRKTIAAATLGATETVTTGAGGAGATAGTGTTGGTSSFGAHAVATGGVGGEAGSSASAGGAGGVGSSGTLNAEGGDGGMGRVESSAPQNGNMGAGGNSYFGAGAGGVSFDGDSSVDGTAGNLYGGGGSGSGNSNGANTTGGAGAAGVVIVTEYYI